MRVATWNLWGRFGPWEARAGGIEDTLRRIDADVVCLQEVWAANDRRQALELAEALSHHVVSSADADEGRSIGNAILSRWPLAEHEVVTLPLGDGRPGFRTAVRALVDAPHGPVPVFCTHLAYRFDESALRARQLDAVCALIESTRLDPADGFPPILCGDLNAVPTSDEIRSLTGEGPTYRPTVAFTDAWAAVGRGPGHTWDGRNPHLRDSSWPRRRLDYVMVGWPRPKPLGNPLRARLAGGRTVDGVVPSDHLAVVVDLCTEGPRSRR